MRGRTSPLSKRRIVLPALIRGRLFLQIPNSTFAIRNSNLYILGINAYHGDAAAAIINDGKLIAAVEEERFSRVKHCAGFPAESVRYCLRAAGIGIEDVEHVGISRNPSAHLHKKILFAATRLAKSRRQRGISDCGFRIADLARSVTSTVSLKESADTLAL